MIRLLTGENGYEISQQRNQIVAEFIRQHGDDGMSVIDGGTVSIDQLPTILMSASLFSNERLIVINDSAGQKAVWEKLADILPEVSEDTMVLLVEPGADKRTRTYKWLQKNADVTVLANLNEAHLVSWLQTLARASGIELAPNVARYMIEFTGGEGNQSQLQNDIAKLALAEKPITNELIRELLVPNPASSAFDLLDAALNGKKERVNELLEGVRTHEDPYRFFGLLSNQIFAVMIVGAAGDRPPDMIAKDAGLHPFVVRKTQPIAKRLNRSQRLRLSEVAATTDMQLKSSGMDPWVLITAALKSMVV